MAFTKELVGSGLFVNQARAIQGAVDTGVTADAGSTQAAAYQITKTVTVVATVGTIGDSLRLPAGEAGDEVWVRNNAANSLDVFPQVGGAVNGGSANAAFAIAGTKTAMFKAISALDWVAVTTA